MNSKNSLIVGRGIFLLIIIVSLGLLVISEKKGTILEPKIDKKIDEYIETNYSDILNNINKNSIYYKNNSYIKKISSKDNKNLYFYVIYKDKEITDTYKKDYIEGKSLLDYLNKDIEKKIQNKIKIKCKVNSVTKLNDYSEKVQERIIKEDNLLELKFYYIQKEIMINDWNSETITNEINNLINKVESNNITPKYYEITITNKNEITTSIKISNITKDFVELNNNKEVIEDILNNKNTELIKENKITFEYNN